MANSTHKKELIKEFFDRLAPQRNGWIRRNQFFYDSDNAFNRFLVPPESTVLELGCGTGQLLAALTPSRGVGLDLSDRMIEIARADYPDLEFHVGDMEDADVLDTLDGPFDVIILSDSVGMLQDIETTFANFHRLCTNETRVIIAYYSHLWDLPLRLAEKIAVKMPQIEQNWLSPTDIAGLLQLADFEVVSFEWRQLLPKRLFGIGRWVNQFIGTLPGIRRLSLRNYVVSRPQYRVEQALASVTIVVPCRNERGNIEPVIERIPQFIDDLEILFVEGHSNDGTLEEIKRVIDTNPELDIKVLVQPGKGKGDAVRAGFAQARGDVLMILDADLTVPPETVPNFFRALANGKGEFINGSRLIYPREKGAMRLLNGFANSAFSFVLSWLIRQRLTDTLCGTKVLTKRHYERIAANKPYFGDFDPFGDFDLLFGAAKLNLKITEVPIRYADRSYGETQISRFRDGWKLLRMVLFAYRRLKTI